MPGRSDAGESGRVAWLLWAGEGPDMYLVAVYPSPEEAERGRDRYSARWPKTVVSIEGRPMADDTWDVRPIYRGSLDVVDIHFSLSHWSLDFAPPAYQSVNVHRPAGVAGMTQYCVESARSPEHARELAEDARRNDRGRPA